MVPGYTVAVGILPIRLHQKIVLSKDSDGVESHGIRLAEKTARDRSIRLALLD